MTKRPMRRQRRTRNGMTAIEVLASTLLAALLMTALVGVLLGLKATEHALELRSSEASWKASLDAALAADFANARTFTWTPNSLALEGFGGRDAGGTPTWLPSSAAYSVEGADRSSWLVRREQAATGGASQNAANLVLQGVRQIRIRALPVNTGEIAVATPASPVITLGVPSPLNSEVVVEFWGQDQLLYSYRHHAP
jgi:type II secretory pathway pseudopilin PulG